MAKEIHPDDPDVRACGAHDRTRIQTRARSHFGCGGDGGEPLEAAEWPLETVEIVLHQSKRQYSGPECGFPARK